MILYRICKEVYANLEASGFANRWNKEGQYVIYCAGSISLAALELLAHTSGIRPKGVFKVMHLNIEANNSIFEPVLPDDWPGLASYPFSQDIGTEWYEQKSKLLLKIPSAIVPQESNYAINTRHRLFDSKVHVPKSENFIWDERFPED